MSCRKKTWRVRVLKGCLPEHAACQAGNTSLASVGDPTAEALLFSLSKGTSPRSFSDHPPGLEETLPPLPSHSSPLHSSCVLDLLEVVSEALMAPDLKADIVNCSDFLPSVHGSHEDEAVNKYHTTEMFVSGLLGTVMLLRGY